MPLNDSNDKVALYVKDLEERVTDLEGGSSGDSAPRVAPSAAEDAGAEDVVTGVAPIETGAATWDAEDDMSAGWDIGTWD